MEVERDGKLEDIWNPNTLRNVFNTVDELKPTGIGLLKDHKESVKNIFTLQGIRLSKNWEELPVGVYIIDGKKVIKTR